MQYSRRDFSKLVAVSPLAAQSSAAARMPVRRLGRIGFQAGILGWGAQHVGQMPAEQSVVDRIVAEALEGGVNYIDTAPNYGISEDLLGRALKGRRDRVFLSTKIETRTRADAMEQVRNSLRRLQTDHLDCVQFHNLGRTDRFPDIDSVLSRDGAMAALMEARKQGMTRYLGCTTHTNAPRILKVLGEVEIDAMTCVLNFVDRHIYKLEESLLPEARRRNIPVIAMKALGGPRKPAGARLESPEDFRQALRYVWSLPGVAVAIVGFRSPEELRPGLAAAWEFKPLTSMEMNALMERGRTLAAEWGPTRGAVIA
ncbi:MAG: aldo/keto reductase [Bryobacterales bacterium]|nr:aldo/keto reductase [Bryobacterales bacterium]